MKDANTPEWLLNTPSSKSAKQEKCRHSCEYYSRFLDDFDLSLMFVCIFGNLKCPFGPFSLGEGFTRGINRT